MNNDTLNPHKRVILLLDMDCFYAQCEMVRLNVPRHVPLALLQWSSALAVNYAARDQFQIKRGDTFEIIANKSRGECVTIHLPVTPVGDEVVVDERKGVPGKSVELGGNGVEEGMGENDNFKPDGIGEGREFDGEGLVGDGECDQSSAIKTAYDKEFTQPQHIREQMYKMEKNKMRYPSEGKANLDRYRLASSRIFSLIYETLVEHLGKDNFIMERASIDELFVDVTAFCYKSCPRDKSGIGDCDCEDEANDTGSCDSEIVDSNTKLAKFRSDCEGDISSNQLPKETVVCHQESVDFHETNSEIGRALRRGCYVAWTARKAVLDTLGFTLSAGISTNKLVSKLAASYGKPNGQAVILPSAMPNVMEETQLRKARLLGGKLGKKVQSLLPENETTMGSISRLMPLDQLEKEIGKESGRWVFDACRGIDYEEVKATLKVLPKSITAFKSFQKVSYPELEKWTALLARDIMKRVEIDNSRNNRLPKSVTVGYTMIPGGAWIGQSFRLPFPTEKDFNLRVQKLCDNTRRVLNERKHSSFIRIGFSAVDFVVRPKVGIDSFFSKGKPNHNQSFSTKRIQHHGLADDDKNATAKSGGLDRFFSSRKQQVASPTLTPTCFINNCGIETASPSAIRVGNGSGDCQVGLETDAAFGSIHAATLTDEEIARQLQETYNKQSGGNNDASSSDLFDRDLALASQLQTKYDRESAVLSHIERFSPKGGHKKAQVEDDRSTRINKKSKLDSFFLKK